MLVSKRRKGYLIFCAAISEYEKWDRNSDFCLSEHTKHLYSTLKKSLCSCSYVLMYDLGTLAMW
jgi:hypothetical protein